MSSRLALLPFTADMLPAAGALLARRHHSDRQRLPGLPPDFEDPAIATQAVSTLWAKEAVQGVAAVQGERLLGYMLGQRQISELWGRSAWIRPAGLALANEQDVELARQMYAVLAAEWVAWGIMYHFALLPTANPALLDAFFRLSFGVEQIYALADLETLDLTPPDVPGLTLRAAQPEDRATLAEFAGLIWQHQIQTPVFGIHLPEDEINHPTQYADLVDDAEATVWLAIDAAGQAQGMQVYYPAEGAPDNLLATSEYGELVVAGVHPEARGAGINRALTVHGLAHLSQNGCRYCQTDWRAANLLSARTWPRQGFIPAHYRLVRRIDPRIAWAK